MGSGGGYQTAMSEMDNRQGITSSMVLFSTRDIFSTLETDNGHPDAPILPRIQSLLLWTLINEYMFSRVVVLNLFSTNVFFYLSIISM